MNKKKIIAVIMVITFISGLITGYLVGYKSGEREMYSKYEVRVLANEKDVDSMEVRVKGYLLWQDSVIKAKESQKIKNQ